MKHHVAVIAAFALLCAVACVGQNIASADDSLNVTREYTHAAVVSLKDLIAHQYFDTASIPRILQALDASEAQGDYAGAADIKDLASKLNTTIAATVNDKHLLVRVDSPDNSTTAEPSLDRAEQARRENYGLGRVEILPGNVGYVEIRAFYRATEGGESLKAAMDFLRHTDALILDLRKNSGGSPDTAIQLLSYFFDTPETPFLSIITRDGAPIRYTKVVRNVSYSDETRPLYVLVSSSTWSAGEAIPFVLQERHRAVIVGERTPGAANPASPPLSIAKGLSVTIPYGCIESAVRKANWETQGVLPDLEVKSERAQGLAYRDALRKLIAGASDPARRKWLANALAAATEHE